MTDASLGVVRHSRGETQHVLRRGLLPPRDVGRDLEVDAGTHFCTVTEQKKVR